MTIPAHQPHQEEEPVVVDKWIHPASRSCLNSIYNCEYGLRPQSCKSIKYDGALTDPGAPKGIWFEANTFNGKLKSTSIYPLETNSETTEASHVGLVFDVHWLLASFGTPWHMYHICSATTEKGNHIEHYAIVAEDQKDWFDKQANWQEHNGHGTQRIRCLSTADETLPGQKSAPGGNQCTKTDLINCSGGIKEGGAMPTRQTVYPQARCVRVLGRCEASSHACKIELLKEGRRFVWKVPDWNCVSRTSIGVFLVPPRDRLVPADLIIAERTLRHVMLTDRRDQAPVCESRWRFKWVEHWSSPCDLKSNEERIVCNECNMSPIMGVRYKCMACDSYDLCCKCAGLADKLHCVVGGQHQLRPIGRVGERHARIIQYVQRHRLLSKQ